MTDQRLRVDWPSCTARGVCHELLPEMIDLDDWGYPVTSRDPVAPELVGFARTAVRLCPQLALRLVEVSGPGPRR
jgi:ferredoxin